MLSKGATENDSNNFVTRGCRILDPINFSKFELNSETYIFISVK